MLAIDQAIAGNGPIVGLLGISGVFDLRPLLHTSINIDLRMSAEEAVGASPLLRLTQLRESDRLMPLLGLVGGDETAGFKQWTAGLVSAWRAQGGKASYKEITGCNHFTILDEVAKADGEVLSVITSFLV